MKEHPEQNGPTGVNKPHFHLELVSEQSSGFPGGASGKDPPANAGDAREMRVQGLALVAQTVESLPTMWETCLGEGNGTPLEYSCLENPMDRGAWWATVHGVAMSSDVTE